MNLSEAKLKQKKPTDKERLDWLTEHKATVQWYFEGWQVRHAKQMCSPLFRTSIRAAIDADMEKQSHKHTRKPKSPKLTPADKEL